MSIGLSNLENPYNTAKLPVNQFDRPSEDCDAVFPQAHPIRCRPCHVYGRDHTARRIHRLPYSAVASDSADALLRRADELSWNGNWFSAVPLFRVAFKEN